MLIIDSHTHLGKSKLSSIDISDSDLLGAMDRWQVGAALVIPHAAPEESFAAHDTVKLLTQKYPARFFGIVAHNPLKLGDDYAAETRRCIEEYGFRGIKFHPLLFSLSPMMPKAQVVFHVAAELEVPVIVHTGTGVPWSLPSLCIPIARQYPELKIVIAHSGMTVFADEAYIAASECANIYLEVSWTAGFQIKHFISSLGPKRIMFGSDLPENVGVELTKLKSLDLNENELSWILGKTADTVFGLDLFSKASVNI